MPQGTTSFARLEGDGGAAVAQTVRETLGRLRAGEPLRAGKLTLIPLLPAEEGVAHTTGYLPLESAVAQQVMAVTEKPAATVPELVVSSTAEAPVLMICGEQVIGGLQNRVFNTTMLVAAHTTLDVPVTCVEMGRWHGAGAHGFGYRRAGQPGAAPERAFTSAEPAYARMRAKHMAYVTKSLASGGGYTSDQSEVWGEVSERLSSTGVSSGTSAMRAMYEMPDRSASMDETVAQLPRPKGALGFVALVAGKPVGGEIFTDDALAEAYWPRLTRSYAMDALDNLWSTAAAAEAQTGASDEQGTRGADVAESEADFLAGAREAEVQAYVSPGLGNDVRLAGAKLAGAGLVHEGALVHLSLFPDEQSEAQSPEQQP
ncbi:MAG TPA: DUF6569 family protein [Ktedonobacterales bacterium]|nr:DUF6569 family protein [Ktedonobacterales bacterium]